MHEVCLSSFFKTRATEAQQIMCLSSV